MENPKPNDGPFRLFSVTYVQVLVLKVFEISHPLRLSNVRVRRPSPVHLLLNIHVHILVETHVFEFLLVVA